MKITTSIFNSWVTCPKPNPQANLRLFCFPYAGASALTFRTWSDNLAPNVEVCPIELALNGTPANVLENNELMQLLIPILRADFAVLETYAYTLSAPLECPITAFGGLQDQEVSLEELLGWQEQTKAFSLQMFPGDHFFIHSAQALLLKTLAESLKAPTCT